MEMKEQANGDVVILQISGTAWTGPDLEPLHDRIKESASDAAGKVIVDCSEVAWFASALLGVFAASVMILRKGGGDLKLACLSSRLHQALVVCQLAAVLDIADTVEEAVERFDQQ